MSSKTLLLLTPDNQPKSLYTPSLITKANIPQKNQPTNNNNRRTSTSAEFNEQRANGICFWCDAKYDVGHKCRGKKPKLYHIEVEETDEEEEEK